MSGTDERRIDARLSINHEFSSVEDFITEYVSNLSRTGVFIRSDDPLPVGTQVHLRFTVISDELEIIEGKGEIVRRIEPGTPGQSSGMGVVFVELTQVSRELLERILIRR